MATSRLFIAAEEFDWTLAIEPWAETYEVGRGQPVMIEATAQPDEHYVWSVGLPGPLDRSVTIDVMADARRVVIGLYEIERVFGPWPK